MPDKPIPAARVASEKILGFRTRQVETVLSVGTSAAVLVKNNPDRVFLSVILEGSNSVFVGRDGSVSTSSGIPLLSQWDAINWRTETDGEATGYERHAIANVGASNVRVIETIKVRDA